MGIACSDSLPSIDSFANDSLSLSHTLSVSLFHSFTDRSFTLNSSVNSSGKTNTGSSTRLPQSLNLVPGTWSWSVLWTFPSRRRWTVSSWQDFTVLEYSEVSVTVCARELCAGLWCVIRAVGGVSRVLRFCWGFWWWTLRVRHPGEVCRFRWGAEWGDAENRSHYRGEFLGLCPKLHPCTECRTSPAPSAVSR